VTGKGRRGRASAREQGNEGNGSLSARPGPAQGRRASLAVGGAERAPHQVRNSPDAPAPLSTSRRGASPPTPVPTHLRSQVAVEGWLRRRSDADCRMALESDGSKVCSIISIRAGESGPPKTCALVMNYVWSSVSPEPPAFVLAQRTVEAFLVDARVVLVHYKTVLLHPPPCGPPVASRPRLRPRQTSRSISTRPNLLGPRDLPERKLKGP
jgi:hypothetical protein